MRPNPPSFALAIALSAFPAVQALGYSKQTAHFAFLMQSWKQGQIAGFRGVDLNHDSFISHAELPLPQYADTYREYDYDQDGRISIEEFSGKRPQRVGAEHLLSDANKHFPQLDSDHSGRIDRRELTKLKLYTAKGLIANPKAIRFSTLSKADQNNDSSLTRLEFERFLGILYAQLIGWGV